MKWLKRLILSVQFMTRIPIRARLDADEVDFGKCSVFFPAVGLIVGLFMAAAMFLFANLTENLWIGAILSVAASVFLTGALHVDGLGDTADGLFCNKSRGRMLEVMRDSRIGTNACLAIALSVLLKCALIVQLFEWAYFPYPALLIVPVAGRLCVTACASFSQYAREEGGLGKSFIENIGYAEFLGAAAIAAVIALFTGGAPHLLALLLAFLGAFLACKWISRILGGMTGDTLGAINEIGEIVCLFALCLMQI